MTDAVVAAARAIEAIALNVVGPTVAVAGTTTVQIAPDDPRHLGDDEALEIPSPRQAFAE